MGGSLLIVGASVRPWISSALAGGYRVVALDFFADWDALQFIGAASPDSSVIRQIDRFEEVFTTEELADCDTAVVCGGFENRVDLVRRLAQSVRVLGTQPDDLEVLRDPSRVWGRLERSGFQVPKTKTNLERTDQAASWLQKQIGTSGGLGVRLASIDDVGGRVDAGFYYQSIVSGAGYSAMFVSAGTSADDNPTRLVGVTRQWVGEPKFGAAQFSYCGSVGPIELSTESSAYLARLGRCLGAEFGLVGVWGLDFIVNDNGIWPVDLNPRLAASMELYESSIGQWNSPIRSVVDLHLRACQSELVDLPPLDEFSASQLIEGKAVLFNRSGKDLKIGKPCFKEISRLFDAPFFAGDKCGFSVADVPHAGELIKIGQPVLTLRVRGVSEDEVSKSLGIRAAEIFDCLGITIAL